MRHWIGSGLVPTMACRLFDTKPVFKPMLCYCQLDSYEHTSVKFWSDSKGCNHENASENMVRQMAAIFSRGDELTHNCCYLAQNTGYVAWFHDSPNFVFLAYIAAVRTTKFGSGRRWGQNLRCRIQVLCDDGRNEWMYAQQRPTPHWVHANHDNLFCGPRRPDLTQRNGKPH